jgi:hypothetical protein
MSEYINSLADMKDREIAEQTLMLTEEAVIRLRAVMQVLEAVGNNPMMQAFLPKGFAMPTQDEFVETS